MNITKYLITGDCHSNFNRFKKIHDLIPEDEIWGMIILGDASLNFWMCRRDKYNKEYICKNFPRLRFFCVRGNHEARPEDIPGMEKVYLSDIENFVYHEREFFNIFYLIDGHDYFINKQRVLVIGGAYSVDKHYRLEREAMGGYAGWFENEQLSKEEMENISIIYNNQSFDLIFAHTCPLSYQPTDLFLSYVDQSKVDNSMETWMEDFIKKIDFKQFYFGHYHEDRIVNEKARMFYKDIIEL